MSVPYPYLIEVPMPILTPRLEIRPPQRGDGPKFHAAVSSCREHLGRFLPWAADSHQTLDDSENFARRSYAKFCERSDIIVGFFDRKTGQLLGGSGLHRIDWDLPMFEIGYWVHQDSEGQGYVSETVNALTSYAFKQLNAKRVEIRCETDNVRSRSVAERLGFHLDGILRKDRFKIGTRELTDTYIYSRLDTEGLPELAVSWS